MTEFAVQKYANIRKLQDTMQRYYERRVEDQGDPKPKKLYKLGQKVRILNKQRKGQTKHSFLPYSKDVYIIKEVRRSSKSYLLELVDHSARQKLRIILHDRRIKPVVDRPERLEQTI